MVRSQMPAYTPPSRKAAAPPGQDVDALQDEIKALEAQLARAMEEEMADPDGDYVEEEYEEELLDEDGYVIEEIVDDGQEYVGDDDDEIIEVVEYEEEYEEVVEEEEEVIESPPPSPAGRPSPFGGGGGGGGRSALMSAIQNRGGATGVDSDVPTSPKGNSSSRAPAPRPVTAGGGGGPRSAPAPPPPKNGRSGVDLSSVKLKATGINLAEAEADSPYTNKGPAPRAQPARDPPKPVAARDSPQAVAKPKNFLQGVQDSDDRAAAAEAKALKAVEDAEDAQTRKKWIPMKERNPEKYPKNSMEAREAPKKKTTKLAPLPFRPRKYPSVPVSPSGQETPMEKMLGPYLYYNSKLDRFNTTSAMKDQDIVCLYFGASWRAGCKAFQQQIIDFYKLTNKDCNLECVYISADRTLFEFKDVYSKFPFLAIPTGTVDLKNQMTKDFKISDLPALIVLNAQTGHLITVDGVDEVLALPPRDRDHSQKLVNDWKQRKASPARGGGGGAPQAAPAGNTSKPEQAPPPEASKAGKSVGRKERKGLLFWKKQ